MRKAYENDDGELVDDERNMLLHCWRSEQSCDRLCVAQFRTYFPADKRTLYYCTAMPADAEGLHNAFAYVPDDIATEVADTTTKHKDEWKEYPDD